jgi:arabinogalactan endo-1,4-beta-galactosidase
MGRPWSADYARGMEKFGISDLQVAVSNYTATILTEISPDIIQIGNEINSGMLWPQGHLINNEVQCLVYYLQQVLQSGLAPNTKIMIHYAGVKATDTDWFFNKMKSVDYDYIVVLSNLAWKRFRSCKTKLSIR